MVPRQRENSTKGQCRALGARTGEPAQGPSSLPKKSRCGGLTRGLPPTAELRAQGCSRDPSSLRAVREQDPFTSWMEEVLARAGLSVLLTQEVPQSCPLTPTMHNAIVFWTLSLSNDMFLDGGDGGHPRPALWQGSLSLSPLPSRAAVNICVACMLHNSRGLIQDTLWAMPQALCSTRPAQPHGAAP